MACSVLPFAKLRQRWRLKTVSLPLFFFVILASWLCNRNAQRTLDRLGIQSFPWTDSAMQSKQLIVAQAAEADQPCFLYIRVSCELHCSRLTRLEACKHCKCQGCSANLQCGTGVLLCHATFERNDSGFEPLAPKQGSRVDDSLPRRTWWLSTPSVLWPLFQVCQKLPWQSNARAHVFPEIAEVLTQSI